MRLRGGQAGHPRGTQRTLREAEPAKVWVSVQVRQVYACSCCDVAPVTAPAPPAPLPRTQASASLLAHVGASKFVDALPLHRQADILTRRFGVPFTSTTLAAWMIQSADRLLKPLVKAMLPTLMACDYWHRQMRRACRCWRRRDVAPASSPGSGCAPPATVRR